jgi:SAM-dependent methyltransferase
MKSLTITDRILLPLFRAFPPTDIIFKDAGGRPEGEYQDELNVPFGRYFGLGDELFQGRDVLDLGCGYGGRAVRFLQLGARSVVGVEVEEEKILSAREFARQSATADRSTFLVGVGEDLPVADSSVDLIIMNDVMEHVIDPSKVLDEIYRVLKPKGRAAIVFPPYYDIISGSHLHGYATSLPGLNLLFSSTALKSATRHLLEQKGVEYRRYLRDVPTDKLWNMNGLTVRGFLDLLRPRRFGILKLVLQGHRDYRFMGQRGFRKALSWPFVVAAQLPFVREAFCNRVCVLLSKDQC